MKRVSGMPETVRFARRRQRGATAVLAMLFLVLFSTMAVGFYASTTLNAQVSNNDARASRAFLAAETGIGFMRWQLAQFIVPANTRRDQLLPVAANRLMTQMNGSGNLYPMTVGYTAGATSILIPSVATQYIATDSTGGEFRADISQSGSELVVKVTGRDRANGVKRSIQLNFHVAEMPSNVFDYGLATNGAMTLSGGILKGNPDATRGSYLSTTLATNTPLTMSGSAAVSGKVYFSNPAGAVSGNGSIFTPPQPPATWGTYIKPGTPAPEFPTLDPTPYVDYMATQTMTNITGSTSATPLSNIRIKAGANPNFSGGGTIKGLVFIEAPNKVTFSGGTNFTGVIVVDNPDEATTTNAITFSGGGTMTGPENLDASYGALRSMTGASILAPNFAVILTGGSATFGGSVLAKSVSLSGGSGGSINGSVISYGTASTTFSGGSGFTFTNSGPVNLSAVNGIHFRGRFAPTMETYIEPK